jgi:hypothetical protein
VLLADEVQAPGNGRVVLEDGGHEIEPTLVLVLAAFVPKGQTIWEFLEVIEDAYEKA